MSDKRYLIFFKESNMKRTKIIKIFIAVVLTVILVEGASGTDYYVATDGSDSNDGLTPETPWKTITFALSQITGTAENPHTIHVASGTYSTNLTGETFPLNMKSYVSLQGAGAEVTILDAEHQGNTSVLLIDMAGNVTIDGFTVKGGNHTYLGGGIWCSGATPSTVISNNIIRDNTSSVGAIDIQSVDCLGCIAPRIADNIITENDCLSGILCIIDSLEVIGNVINNNIGGGIYNQGLGAFIEDSWIENNSSLGIQCFGCDIISGNLISGNSGIGVHIRGSLQMLIANNIIRNNGEDGITVDRNATPIIGGSEGRGNDIYGHWWSQIYGGGGDEIINAQYNYFGVPIPTSEEIFPFENFDVSNWRESSIVTEGDVNRDEAIDVLDIVLAVKFFTGIIRPTPLQLEAGDLNKDRIIDVQDILGFVNIILYPK